VIRVQRRVQETGRAEPAGGLHHKQLTQSGMFSP
jgi:hypothetical protein